MKPTFTNEQDRWLDANVNGMERSWRRIAECFNARFGTSRTPDSLRRRSAYLLIPSPVTRYSEEQDRWLIAHAYLDRKTMTRMFNKEFGSERTRRSIEQRCAKVKAYKLIEVTGEYKSQCVWTEEIDQWLKDNARDFRDDNGGLVRSLNHNFGTRFTVRAVNYRRWSLGVKTKGFYEEEDRWLWERRYTPTAELTEEFNEAFHEHRSAPCIEKHLSRLEKKALPDEREGTENASHGLDGEITPPNEIKQGETIL